jgi:hypothetical protein
MLFAVKRKKVIVSKLKKSSLIESSTLFFCLLKGVHPVGCLPLSPACPFSWLSLVLAVSFRRLGLGGDVDKESEYQKSIMVL